MSVRTIWKYPLPFPPKDMFMLDIPRGARPIRVEVQQGQPCLWVFVPDTRAPKAARNFAVIGTGHPAPEGGDGYYVGSFHLLGDTFVGHLFADWPNPKDGDEAWAAECEEFGCHDSLAGGPAPDRGRRAEPPIDEGTPRQRW